MNIKNVKQSGVGLVEVLVALLVFSVGMLGVASLQVVSKKSSYEAQQRQEAVLLANEMVSRMKNTGASYQELYTNYDGNDNALIGKSAAAAAKVTACEASAGTCSISEMATHNFTLWEESLSAAAVKIGNDGVAGLIGVKGCVNVVDPNSVTSTNPRLVTVTVSWLSMTKLGVSAVAKTRDDKLSTNCRHSTEAQKARSISIKTYL